MTSLKRQFASGVAYSAFAKYSGYILQLIITAVLSRILTPADFGIVAIVSVLLVFFNLLGDFGIGPAIIQNKSLTKIDISSIFTFTFILGLFLAGVFFVCAGFIAKFYSNEILVSIGRIMSINILLALLNIVPNALLLKDKKFKLILFRQLIIQILSGAIGVVSALLGAGVYALLTYSLSAALFLFLFNYINYPIHFCKIYIISLKKIAHFSLFQFLFNFINYFSRNLDKLLVGKFMGSTNLGYYEKSYRLMLLAIEGTTHTITPVMHSFFSDIQHDKKRIADYFIKIVYILALIGFPLSIFLSFTSRELILIVFGSQWELAILPFKIIAFSIAPQLIYTAAGSIYQSINRVDLLFLIGVFTALITVIAIIYGIFILKNIEGVATCVSIAYFINSIQCYFLLVIKGLKQSFFKFLKIFLFPLIISTLFILIYILFEIFFDIKNIYISLILKFLSFIIPSLIIFFLFKKIILSPIKT